MGNTMEAPQKLKIELLYDPTLLLPKQTKTLTLKGICTPMFTATLRTIAMTCKQPKRPSMDKENVIYTYTIEYHSATKKGIIAIWDNMGDF